MKRVLVIGCSHSYCSYYKNDEFESEQSWAWHLWDQRGRKEKFTVIAHPGRGLMSYAVTLQHLNRLGVLDNFDACIIQLTSEPRMWFYNKIINNWFDELDKDFFDKDDGYKNYENEKYTYSHRSLMLTDTARQNYQLHADKFTSAKAKNQWLDVIENITESVSKTTFTHHLFPVHYKYCIDLLKDHNITPITFAWWGYSHEQYLSWDTVAGNELILPCLMHAAQFRGDWRFEDISDLGHHHNSARSARLAKIVNEYIELSNKL